MKIPWPIQQPRPLDMICMGRVAVDLYAEQIGSSLEEAQTFRKYLGGCAGNIAVGSARQGLHTAMLSCVGADAMGQFLKTELKKEKVDITALKETTQHLTGLVLLGIDPPDRFPLIFYRRDCADMQLNKSDIDPAWIASATSLLMTGTGLSTESMREVSHYVADLAKASQTRVVLDLDYRPVLWGQAMQGDGESRYKASEQVSQHYQSLLSKCDLIVGTEEEMLIAGNATMLSDALHAIRSHTNAPLVVKKGEKGCGIYFDDLHHPVSSRAFPVTILNVLGAGDAFISGFMRGLLRGESWETCALYGNAAGAIVVTRHGCAPAMPTFAEMQEFITHYQAIEETHHVSVSHS